MKVYVHNEIPGLKLVVHQQSNLHPDYFIAGLLVNYKKQVLTLHLHKDELAESWTLQKKGGAPCQP